MFNTRRRKGHEFIFEDKKMKKNYFSSSKDYEVLVANNSNFNIKKIQTFKLKKVIIVLKLKRK